MCFIINGNIFSGFGGKGQSWRLHITPEIVLNVTGEPNNKLPSCQVCILLLVGGNLHASLFQPLFGS